MDVWYRNQIRVYNFYFLEHCFICVSCSGITSLICKFLPNFGDTTLKRPNWIAWNLLGLGSMSMICFVLILLFNTHEAGSCWISGHYVISAVSAHCQLFKHCWIHCGPTRSIWEPDFSCGHMPSSVLYFLTKVNYIEIIFLLELF